MNAFGVRLAMIFIGAALLLLPAACRSGPSPPEAPGKEASRAAVIGGWFDVGGHKLFLTCAGSGSPTIVFESGLGGEQLEWLHIRQALPSVRTCAYDRANVGRSATVGARRTGADSVRELHALLDAAAVPGPYLLVGASIGGLLSIMYAADYPADVVGIVLLDSTLPTLDVILRLMPEPERAAELTLLANNNDLNVLDTLGEARRLLPAVPDIPILMLVARPRPDLPPAWPEAAMHAAMDAAEQEFLGALRQGEQREVRSGHVIQQDAPQVVVDELRGFLDRHLHRMVTRAR